MIHLLDSGVIFAVATLLAAHDLDRDLKPVDVLVLIFLITLGMVNAIMGLYFPDPWI